MPDRSRAAFAPARPRRTPVPQPSSMTSWPAMSLGSSCSSNSGIDQMPHAGSARGPALAARLDVVGGVPIPRLAIRADVLGQDFVGGHADDGTSGAIVRQ